MTPADEEWSDDRWDSKFLRQNNPTKQINVAVLITGLGATNRLEWSYMLFIARTCSKFWKQAGAVINHVFIGNLLHLWKWQVLRSLSCSWNDEAWTFLLLLQRIHHFFKHISADGVAMNNFNCEYLSECSLNVFLCVCRAKRLHWLLLDSKSRWQRPWFNNGKGFSAAAACGSALENVDIEITLKTARRCNCTCCTTTMGTLYGQQVHARVCCKSRMWMSGNWGNSPFLVAFRDGGG